MEDRIQGSDVLYRDRFPSLSKILISQGSSLADLLKYSYYTGCYCMLCAHAYMWFFELAPIQQSFLMVLCWKIKARWQTINKLKYYQGCSFANRINAHYWKTSLTSQIPCINVIFRVAYQEKNKSQWRKNVFRIL